MTDTRSSVQGAALMILLRLFVFFCSDVPYSAAHAAGMFAAALLQAGLMLLLLRVRIPGTVLQICRICALFWAAVLICLMQDLLLQLRLQHPVLCLLLMLPVLLYTVSLPERAADRAATILLCAAGLAFLLLPVSGIGTARRILLYTPDSFWTAFRREWLCAGELPVLLRIRLKQTQDAARRSTLAWAAFRCLFLPALVLFGAMQNGRLMQFAGNPFFLLLARTPLSDAFRTDGFWLMLAVSAGLLDITFCLQQFRKTAPERDLHMNHTARS